MNFKNKTTICLSTSPFIFLDNFKQLFKGHTFQSLFQIIRYFFVELMGGNSFLIYQFPVAAVRNYHKHTNSHHKIIK